MILQFSNFGWIQLDPASYLSWAPSWSGISMGHLGSSKPGSVGWMLVEAMGLIRPRASLILQ